MANTYDLIKEYQIGSGGVSSIEFTSIPATHTDLVLKLSLRTGRSDTTDPVSIWFNGNTTGTSYQYKSIWNPGTGNVDSYSNGGTSNFEIQYATANNSTANFFNNYELYLVDYAGSGNKLGLFQSIHQQFDSSSYMVIMSYQWANSAAINSIKIQSAYGVNISQYSSAYLYGIKKN